MDDVRGKRNLTLSDRWYKVVLNGLMMCMGELGVIWLDSTGINKKNKMERLDKDYLIFFKIINLLLIWFFYCWQQYLVTLLQEKALSNINFKIISEKLPVTKFDRQIIFTKNRIVAGPYCRYIIRLIFTILAHLSQTVGTKLQSIIHRQYNISKVINTPIIYRKVP